MSTSPQRASGANRSQRQIQRSIDQVRTAVRALEATTEDLRESIGQLEAEVNEIKQQQQEVDE